MQRICLFVVMGIFAVVAAAAQDPSRTTSGPQYEVLNPWAAIDPVPLKGISPRVNSMSGKKIGLFANYKRAAMPIAEALKRKLEARYPDSEFSIYHSDRWNVTEAETNNREKFADWVEEVDAVVLAVGD